MSDERSVVGTRPMPDLPPSDRPVEHLQALLLSNELDGRADAIGKQSRAELQSCLRRASKALRGLLGVPL